MRDTLLWALLRDEAGEVVVSYALVAVLISIIAAVAFSNLGMSTVELIDRITSVIESKG
ncbi:MAG: Flp family type IVb pilin [Alphaproteobacteria bacterium]|jgi:Flp pilus assembly pilin Flp